MAGLGPGLALQLGLGQGQGQGQGIGSGFGSRSKSGLGVDVRVGSGLRIRVLVHLKARLVRENEVRGRGDVLIAHLKALLLGHVGLGVVWGVRVRACCGDASKSEAVLC